MNFYAILGIPADADQETIRMAFRTLARRYHPDMGSGSSPEKFRQIAHAYEILSNPQRRQAYDRSLRPQPMPFPVAAEPMTGAPEPLANPFRPVRRRADYSPIGLFDTLLDELMRFIDDPFSPRW